MQSVIDGTRSKTLRFEHHATIENTQVKLKAMYNPLKRFAHQFMPGYKIPRSHETTSFSYELSRISPKGIVLAS